MDTWLFVVLVVVLVVVAAALIALLVLAMSKRSRISDARKREQAREQLHEARVRSARADKEQALAEEQAAHARRELAEVQERAALAEQEARARAARADEDRSAAEKLRAQAEKAAPDLVHGKGTASGDHTTGRNSVVPDGTDQADPHPTGGATRR